RLAHEIEAGAKADAFVVVVADAVHEEGAVERLVRHLRDLDSVADGYAGGACHIDAGDGLGCRGGGEEGARGLLRGLGAAERAVGEDPLRRPIPRPGRHGRWILDQPAPGILPLAARGALPMHRYRTERRLAPRTHVAHHILAVAKGLHRGATG